jgi:hypothetical protein
MTLRKIFGIGASKTATSSLGKAFRMMGFSHIGWNELLEQKYTAEDYQYLYGVVESYDSFEDTPWNSDEFYMRLDLRFPRSKFILTIRDTASWIRSYTTYFKPLVPNVEEQREQLMEAYERRNRGVLAYFAHRPDDLLVLNICDGEGWEKLCPFLGCSVPAAPFPHKNKNPFYSPSTRGGGALDELDQSKVF